MVLGNTDATNARQGGPRNTRTKANFARAVDLIFVRAVRERQSRIP